MALKAKTTTIDVKGLDPEKDRIADLDENDRRPGRIANGHVNANAIGKEIETEGEDE